jgi:hypothetical protein
MCASHFIFHIASLAKLIPNIKQNRDRNDRREHRLYHIDDIHRISSLRVEGSSKAPVFFHAVKNSYKNF